MGRVGADLNLYPLLTSGTSCGLSLLSVSRELSGGLLSPFVPLPGVCAFPFHCGKSKTKVRVGKIEPSAQALGLSACPSVLQFLLCPIGVSYASPMPPRRWDPALGVPMGIPSGKTLRASSLRLETPNGGKYENWLNTEHLPFFVSKTPVTMSSRLGRRQCLVTCLLQTQLDEGRVDLGSQFKPMVPSWQEGTAPGV